LDRIENQVNHLVIKLIDNDKEKPFIHATRNSLTFTIFFKRGNKKLLDEIYKGIEKLDITKIASSLKSNPKGIAERNGIS
jgi:hypothetical protein